MPRCSARDVAFVIALAIAATADAHASCPSIAGADAGLAARDEAERLAWIRARLARSSHRATFWLRGWEIGILAATATDLALIPILGNTRDHRIDFGLGAATTIVGIVPLILLPPREIEDHRALERAAPDGDRCVQLADAERRLIADAGAEAQQRSWYFHVGNVLLNGGVTLLFGAFHHWTSGVINGVGGAIVGELIIFSQPIDQVDDLAHYRRGELGSPAQPSVQLVPLAAPHAAGVGVAIRF